MQVSNSYIVVEPIEKEKVEGFQTVETQDSFVYQGRVIEVPEAPIFMGNAAVGLGDTILFAKYSPDSHEIELEGKKYRFVSVRDILAKL